MPQFDIVSFFPQITFFAGIFLVFYAYLCKEVLPKISQNLKLYRRISDMFQTKGSNNLNVLMYVYQPSRALSSVIYRETLCIVFLTQFSRILLKSFFSGLNFILFSKKKDFSAKLSKLCTSTLSDIS